MLKKNKIESPAQKHADVFKSDFGLDNHGFKNLDTVYWNLPVSALYEEAIFRNEGRIVNGGAFLVNTGKWTARAANEKYFVKESLTGDKIDWGKNNRPLSPECFEIIYNRLQAYMQGRELFVQDVFVGADPGYQLPIRVITDTAWQSFFARNMFIPESNPDNHKTHIPDFTVIAAPSFKLDPRIDGTASETGIIINFEKRVALVINTEYAGEIKKSIFTIMNFLMPLQDVMSMHCSANVGKKGDVALFFGLSGTGKTTLSADPLRKLIGDDEHAWSDDSVFNYENGCYAKVIRLSAESEPEIYACTSKFGCILENVIFDDASRMVNLDDDKITENTRASYPLDFIPNSVPEKMMKSHPKNVIFLTCDAQGVMPPISKLDMNQAIYHFMSGYTSKIAGTEIGLGIEPEIAFSACFGAPFMVHHPYFYAELLRKKIEKHGANVWLVNTGWVGGKFGIGKRISIKHTRNLLNAVLDGSLDNVKFKKDKIFGYEIPQTCPNVPEEVLDPSNAWSDKDEYWAKYSALATRYLENFRMFESGCPKEIINAGPKKLKQGS